MVSLKRYVRSATPAVAIETYEEHRFCDLLHKQYPKRKIWVIDAIGGLQDLNDSVINRDVQDYDSAFAELEKQPPKSTFLVVLDYQHVISNPAAYRSLISVMAKCKSENNMIILLAPSWTLPPELERRVPLLQDSLPNDEQLTEALDLCLKGASEDLGKEIVLSAEKRASIISAATGLTYEEAESSIAMCAYEDFDQKIVEAEKLRLVRRRSLTVENAVPIEDVGGLGNLKEYIALEVIPWMNDPKLRVRGLLFVGPAGTGKSLISKAIASMLGVPLVRLNISAAKGSLQGESQKELRNALKVVSAMGRCVLWIDEIEKAVGGYASSGQTDGGTTSEMIGELLTWMQEHTLPVLAVATCNDYTKLPPELPRPGRVNKRYFLDIPAASERIEVAKIHLRKLGVQATGVAELVATLTPDFTPAEIAEVICSAARRSNYKMTEGAIKACAREIKPIAKTPDYEKLRKWGRDNLPIANDMEVPTAATTGRRISRDAD
jgi:ATP-dependent 26S proteasome regulatory subunit